MNLIPSPTGTDLQRRSRALPRTRVNETINVFLFRKSKMVGRKKKRDTVSNVARASLRFTKTIENKFQIFFPPFFLFFFSIQLKISTRIKNKLENSIYDFSTSAMSLWAYELWDNAIIFIICKLTNLGCNCEWIFFSFLLLFEHVEITPAARIIKN